MPLYEYFCKTCNDKFEVLRPMGKVAVAEACPEGHPGAVKVLSVFATVSSGSSAEACNFDSQAGCGSCGSVTPGACNLN